MKSSQILGCLVLWVVWSLCWVFVESWAVENGLESLAKWAASMVMLAVLLMILAATFAGLYLVFVV